MRNIKEYTNILKLNGQRIIEETSLKMANEGNRNQIPSVTVLAKIDYTDRSLQKARFII